MLEPQNITVDWDIIVETIKAEKCILFLGPELFTNSASQKLEEQLVQFLNVEDDPKVRIYEDPLFFFRERSKKTLTYYKIKNFYDQQFEFAEQLFEKIAQIPFHLIVSLTPEKKLHQKFKALNLKNNFEFYWKNQVADESLKVPNRNRPLIYNLLGSIDRQESLILTHDDLFDYFDSIFQGKSMPSRLRHHIMREADNFIFLGIQFDKWYMQLLLRILHLHKDEEFVRYAANQEISREVQTLCYDHFKINFIPNNLSTFVEEIYDRCAQEGILRKAGAQKQSMVEQLKDWLVNDEIEKVFRSFIEFLQSLGDLGAELIEDVKLLMNRHRRLDKKLVQGIIGSEAAELETNKIRKTLLDLLNEAKSYE